MEQKDAGSDRIKRFSAIALPHLDAAYNLARWLARDDPSAPDAVQEAYMRGLRYFDSLHGDDAKRWLLGIVRNCCYTWLKDRGRQSETLEFDEDRDSDADDSDLRKTSDTPEHLLIRKRDRVRVDQAIEGLPIIFREVIILWELEELSYEQIAEYAAIPLGTVMSRLAGARAMLRAALSEGSRRTVT